MEINDYKQIMKDLKTALKFARIARTMLTDIANKIAEDNPQTTVAPKLLAAAEEIDKRCANVELATEDFKTEQKVPGCQLSLFENAN